MDKFELHPLLQKDTLILADWPLCRLLLMNDQTYPWLVLVPRRPNLVDLHDVSASDAPALSVETRRASRELKAAVGAEKMNVAALGNVCPQLHIHVIARFQNDAAWPKPVWNLKPARPYDDAGLDAIKAKLSTLIG